MPAASFISSSVGTRACPASSRRNATLSGTVCTVPASRPIVPTICRVRTCYTRAERAGFSWYRRALSQTRPVVRFATFDAPVLIAIHVKPFC
jgi:hypothetical protein